MQGLVITGIFSGLVSAFVILFLIRTGLRDKMIRHSRIRLLADLLECDFCFGFWINCLICLVIAIVSENIFAIFVPVIATPITRFLI